MTYEEELELDLRVFEKLLDPRVGDLYEGVTALLLEKREPVWRYKSISEVPETLIHQLLE